MKKDTAKRNDQLPSSRMAHGCFSVSEVVQQASKGPPITKRLAEFLDGIFNSASSETARATPVKRRVAHRGR
jgi:hypothetical protein